MNDSAVNRTCLHLVVRSSSGALQRCRSQFSEGDLVLFLDDGVMQLVDGCGDPGLSFLVECCFSATDLEARGLLKLAHDMGAGIVRDSDFADLLRKYEFCLTWK